jgi:hypothetical protein
LKGFPYIKEWKIKSIPFTFIERDAPQVYILYLGFRWTKYGGSNFESVKRSFNTSHLRRIEGKEIISPVGGNEIAA